MPSGREGSGKRIGDPCKDCGSVINEINAVYKGTYLQPRCKPCFNLHSNRVPSRTRDSRHKHWIGWKYGITEEEYKQKFEEQDGKCAICKQKTEIGKRLAVDHDHKTGNIRDLLCSTCNTILGLVNDDWDYLFEFQRYLHKHGS